MTKKPPFPKKAVPAVYRGLPLYRKKFNLLYNQIMTEPVYCELSSNPAENGTFVVFISICDGIKRAVVCKGVGETWDNAWKAADKEAVSLLHKSQAPTLWVKADIICRSKTVTAKALAKSLSDTRPEFFHWGVAFDQNYNTALLEAEMNGAKIYDYKEHRINLEYLNQYLRKADRLNERLFELPDSYTLFQCLGWICDETDTVFQLESSGLEYGRRKVGTIDAEFVEKLLYSASDFLISQVNTDGSFIYGYYPRFDNKIKSYNIARHATTIWSLLCRYQMNPQENLAAVIEQCITYMLGQIRWSDDNTAFLYDEAPGEIKLGAGSVAVISLTEYQKVFQTDKYTEICRQLGNGILSLMNQETGEYYHVLNGDFSKKEAFRTIYYDGEATFALCRLYGLTGDQVWLDAARSAADHFIAADYTKYRDHWVAYSMSELTRHITDNKLYYVFALQNAQKNLKKIYNRDTTYHTYLELLMITFETYDRMVQNGFFIENFDLEFFLKTIYRRANKMLEGYFFPEYAMYMKNPKQISNTFMVRHDGYRVRMDDVQHNIGAYYLYYKNYEKLIKYGMLEAANPDIS